jgi:hypothetical protein
MKRITEFTIPLNGIGGTYVVEHKHGENLCTVFAKNKPNHIWKKPKEEVDDYFLKEDWITSRDKLELPSKFYITTSSDATAYKYLVTETNGGNYNVTGKHGVAWWKWEEVEEFILDGTWTYFPIESASSFEAGCTTQKDFLELPDKFYFTVNNSESKCLATVTEDGLFFVIEFNEHGKLSSGYWLPEDIKKFLLSGDLTYTGEYKREKIQGVEADWIIVDEISKYENIIAKWHEDKPLADDFYFKWHLTDTLYRAQLHREGYTVSWENTAPCGVGRAETFFTEKQVKDNLKNNVWLIVKSNGIDATGAPLNFTKDMLKPSMRFRTGNGDKYIAVESEIMDDIGNISVDIIGASNNKGWTGFELVNICGDELGEEFRAMAVYEKHADNNLLLIPELHGKLIWKANK